MPFSVPFRVRYSETDRQGIAYQAHYVTWFDLAIWEFLRALPWDMAAHQKARDGDFHTVRNAVDYAAPLAFDQEFSVTVEVQKIGRSKVLSGRIAFAQNRYPLLRTMLSGLEWSHCFCAKPVPTFAHNALT